MTQFESIRKILDNPNGCLRVNELLAAIADECAKNGATPFNTMGGHFIWQATAREIGQLALNLNAAIARHLVHEDPTDPYSTIIGLTPTDK